MNKGMAEAEIIKVLEFEAPHEQFLLQVATLRAATPRARPRIATVPSRAREVSNRVIVYKLKRINRLQDSVHYECIYVFSII
jgi:hypothetical protein